MIKNRKEQIRCSGNSGIGIVIVLVLLAGCFFAGQYMAKKSVGEPAPNPMAAMANIVPAVKVTPVTMTYVDNPREYVGYVEAIETVDLRPQVAGYLEAVQFEEGAFVKKGDPLFVIEQGPYDAVLAVRKAELSQAQADLAQAEKYYNRLKAVDARSVSQNDIDTAESRLLSAKARIEQCQANIQLATIDLDHTVINAPVSGYIGKAIVTEGNYVNSMTESLAQIVQFDPVRVIFSLPDKDYVQAREALGKEADESGLAVRLRLPDGSEYEGVGQLDFEDNKMDPKTATIAVRFKFENKDKRLVPGGYVTVLLGDAQREQALAVPLSAIMSTAEGTTVYVVGADNKAQIRPVELGDQTEGVVVITSGLNEGENVIVQGLQKVSPGSEVKIN